MNFIQDHEISYLSAHVYAKMYIYMSRTVSQEHYPHAGVFAPVNGGGSGRGDHEIQWKP